jgi:precorrin-6B methylase 2
MILIFKFKINFLQGNKTSKIMRSKILLKKMSGVLSLLMIITAIYAQEQRSSTGFSPQVGQRGKDVVWVPTPQELVDKMLEMAKVTSSDFVIDLGSGDGRTVITAAKLGAKARGIEYNSDMVQLSRENAEKAGVTDRTEFVQEDLYKADLSKATVITMFLLPEINLKLRPTLLDLKPGTRIVSNTFTMGDWEEDYKVSTDENWNSWNTAYMWIIPAKVDGNWKFENGELQLTQEYQRFSGTYKVGGKFMNVTDGKLLGDGITFTLNDAKYTGKINGNSMIGTAVNSSTDAKFDWSATRK